jgi:hypothetical protein
VKIYLGGILGEVTLVPSDLPSPSSESVSEFEKMIEWLSDRRCKNAKENYERRKRAFFEYVRKNNIDVHNQRARGAVGRAVTEQLWGRDGDAEDFMKQARKEFDLACRNAWILYQNSQPEQKEEMKILLVQSVGMAQFVDLDNDLTRKMIAEINRLSMANEIKIQAHGA